MKKLISVATAMLLSWGLYRIPLASQAAEEPIFVVTHVDAMPTFTAAARGLLQRFAVASRRDAGAVRIEVFEELSRPNHSTLVEVWKSRKAYEDHLTSDHTRAYRAKLQPMLGSPFDERLHRRTE